MILPQRLGAGPLDASWPTDLQGLELLGLVEQKGRLEDPPLDETCGPNQLCCFAQDLAPEAADGVAVGVALEIVLSGATVTASALPMVSIVVAGWLPEVPARVLSG